MSKKRDDEILWRAQQHGQDWRDEDVLAAVDWLTTLVPHTNWNSRTAMVDEKFQAAKSSWAEGSRVPLYDPTDAIAWYIYQATRYADPRIRPDFFLPEAYRIVPLFIRIGQLLPTLRTINGAEERAAKLMTENLSQPDDGIFELLVAGAYARRGWEEVTFVPEAPGIGKRHDLLVDRGKSHWAVECKRTGRSGYARDERLAGEQMAERAHAMSRDSGRPLIMSIRFIEELTSLDNNYLVDKIEQFLNGRELLQWKDDGGEGIIFDLSLTPLHNVLTHDDIYFGSSRMVELILGSYDPATDFTVEGEWTPAVGRPLHATWVNHVSLVVWKSVSDKAARRKAKHFRSLIARASQQLPGDRPGAIHVGYETMGGNNEDGLRHDLNRQEMRSFEPQQTGLRMVYGNYFMPELVTDQNESAAVTETMAWYPVGQDRTSGPLPGHLLFQDEEGQDGAHF